jgi:hypothetical protein
MINPTGKKLEKLLFGMFNDRVESDTISYENEIKSNINTSLSNLLEKLNNEA